MAAPSYTTSLVDITDAESTTNWNAVGGGASGLSVEPDFTIQGSNCIAKQIKAETKGHLFNNGATAQADLDHVYTWVYVSTPSTTDTLLNGGLRITIGSGTGARKEFYVAGLDTYAKGGWKCYPISYTLIPDATVGSPTSVPSYFGAVMKGTVTAKSPNLGIDIIRYGSEINANNGEVANPCTLTGLATESDQVANAWGIMQLIQGGVLLQGQCRIGSSAATVYDESAVLVVFADNNPISVGQHTQSKLKRIQIENAATTALFTSMSFLSLDKVDRGFIKVIAATSVEFNGCAFQNMGETIVDSTTDILKCSFNNMQAILANTATIQDCTFSNVTQLPKYLYTGVSKGGFGSIFDCAMDPDGTRITIVIDGGVSNRFIRQFSISDPYNLNSTITQIASISVTDAPRGLTFSSTGHKLYVLSFGASIADLKEYDCASNYTISGLTISTTKDIIAVDGFPKDLVFSADGKTIFILGEEFHAVKEITLSTAWDLTSTFTDTGREIDVTDIDSVALGLEISSAGKNLTVTGDSNNIIFSIEMITAYTFNDGVYYTGVNQDVSGQDSGPHGLHRVVDKSKMLMVGFGSNVIYEYSEYTTCILADTLANITNNLFTAGGVGHAVTLTSTGTMTWNNRESGYALTDGSTGNETLFISSTSGTVTINVAAGASTPTVRTAGATVTVQSADKVFDFTVSPSITGYEWRLYTDDLTAGVIGTVELAGEESAIADNQSYSYQYTSDTQVVLQIITAGYEESQTTLTLGDSDQERIINLKKETNT